MWNVGNSVERTTASRIEIILWKPRKSRVCFSLITNSIYHKSDAHLHSATWINNERRLCTFKIHPNVSQLARVALRFLSELISYLYFSSSCTGIRVRNLCIAKHSANEQTVDHSEFWQTQNNPLHSINFLHERKHIYTFLMFLICQTMNMNLKWPMIWKKNVF